MRQKRNHPTRLLHFITEGRHEYASKQHTKKYASPSFQLKDGYGNWDLFGPDRDDRNLQMLIVWASRTVCVSEVEETKEEAHEKLRLDGAKRG